MRSILSVVTLLCCCASVKSTRAEAQGNPFLVNRWRASGHQVAVEAAALSSGYTATLWQGDDYRVEGKLYDAEGNAPWLIRPFHASPESSMTLTKSVAPLENDRFVAVWDAITDNTQAVKVKVYSHRRTTPEVEAELSFADRPSNEWHGKYFYGPNVVGLSSGGFVVGWRHSAPDTAERTLRAQLFGADGKAVGGVQTVLRFPDRETLPAHNDQFHMASLPGTDVVVFALCTTTYEVPTAAWGVGADGLLKQLSATTISSTDRARGVQVVPLSSSDYVVMHTVGYQVASYFKMEAGFVRSLDLHDFPQQARLAVFPGQDAIVAVFTGAGEGLYNTDVYYQVVDFEFNTLVPASIAHQSKQRGSTVSEQVLPAVVTFPDMKFTLFWQSREGLLSPTYDIMGRRFVLRD